jgi:hypothetical protein
MFHGASKNTRNQGGSDFFLPRSWKGLAQRLGKSDDASATFQSVRGSPAYEDPPLRKMPATVA